MADCIATSNREGAYDQEPHAAAQSVRPLVRSGSRPYVPTLQGGTVSSGTLAAEMPESDERLTPRRCWRSLGPPSRALGARLNNNKTVTDVLRYKSTHSHEQ